MHQWLRRRTRGLAAIMALAFVATLSATCVLQAEMTAAEKDCCAKMQMDCGGPMAQSHSCCKTPSVKLDPPLAPSARLALPVPTLTPVVFLVSIPVDLHVTLVSVSPLPLDASPPGSTHPTHVLLSVFRI
jgi:hypothetical protein